MQGVYLRRSDFAVIPHSYAQQFNPIDQIVFYMKGEKSMGKNHESWEMCSKHAKLNFSKFNEILGQKQLKHEIFMRNFPAVAFLLDNGVNACAYHHEDADFPTALHCAANIGDDAMVNRLIASGASVNCANEFGETPLHYAARSGSLPCVKALILANACVMAKNADSLYPHQVCRSEEIRIFLEEISKMLI